MGSGRDKRRKKQRAKRHKTNKWDEWAKKTDATLLTPEAFLEQKQDNNWYVLGVMGFAGAWHRAGRAGEALEHYQREMKAAIASFLATQQALYGGSLVVSSGATNLGVLQITYEICTECEITALGVTPDQTLHYEIGQLDMLIPHGQTYGDESEVFLKTADAFLLVGGGSQSKRETIQAWRRKMPVTVIQGFGGVADEMIHEEYPGVTFLSWMISEE